MAVKDKYCLGENTEQSQEETPPNTKTMYVDGSSVIGQCSVGVLLILP